MYQDFLEEEYRVAKSNLDKLIYYIFKKFVQI